jgi:acyl dehydratase
MTASLRYDDVRIGDELPILEVPLTRSLIVATAIASRDYQDVHHDPALAQEKGSPDIFMNILTTNGFVGRYVTDWAGPNAIVRSVRIRLGAPNHPGDTMRLTGSVTAKADGVVEVGIRGANALGDHVTGTVTLALPDPPAPRASAPSEKDEKRSKKQQKQSTKSKKSKKKSKTSKKGARP